MRKQTTPPKREQYRSIAAIAADYDLSHWTLRDWIRDGKLRAFKFGTGPRAVIRIKVTDVEALLNPITPSVRRTESSAQ